MGMEAKLPGCLFSTRSQFRPDNLNHGDKNSVSTRSILNVKVLVLQMTVLLCAFLNKTSVSLPLLSGRMLPCLTLIEKTVNREEQYREKMLESKYFFSHDDGGPLNGHLPGHLQQQSLKLARHCQLLIRGQTELGGGPQYSSNAINANLRRYRTWEGEKTQPIQEDDGESSSFKH